MLAESKAATSRLKQLHERLRGEAESKRHLEALCERLGSDVDAYKAQVAQLERRLQLIETADSCTKRCVRDSYVNETMTEEDPVPSLQSELEEIEFKFSEIRAVFGIQHVAGVSVTPSSRNAGNEFFRMVTHT